MIKVDVKPLNLKPQPLNLKSRTPNQVDMIKVDVEGAELYVLQGAARLLQAYSPELFIEFSPNTLDFGYHVSEISAFLNSVGYVGRNVGDGNVHAVRIPITGTASAPAGAFFDKLGRELMQERNLRCGGPGRGEPELDAAQDASHGPGDSPEIPPAVFTHAMYCAIAGCALPIPDEELCAGY